VIESDGVKTPVKQGDVLLNPPFGAHALYNTSDRELKLLVFEAAMGHPNEESGEI